MPTYSFGTFQFESETYQLIKPEAVETLQPRPGLLLAYLLENRDRLVPKEELMDHIWQGTVVQDQSIFQCVNQLRRALGDLPRNPMYIRTVSKRGYQWIHPQTFVTYPGEVEAAPEPAPDTDEDPQTTLDVQPDKERKASPTGGFQKKGWWVIAASLVLVSFLMLKLFSPREEPVAQRPSRLALLPFINETGDPNLDWTELGLLDMAFNHLKEELGPELVSLARVLEAREALAFQPGHFLDAAQLKELRQDLGAEVLVHTTLQPSRGGYMLSCMLYGREEVIGNFTLHGENPQLLPKEMAHLLLAKLNGSSNLGDRGEKSSFTPPE